VIRGLVLKVTDGAGDDSRKLGVLCGSVLARWNGTRDSGAARYHADVGIFCDELAQQDHLVLEVVGPDFTYPPGQT
jgi:hypothetical protein